MQNYQNLFFLMFWFVPLVRWHCSHVWQNSRTSFTIVGHQYHLRTCSYVRRSPKCPMVLCAWSNTCVMISRSRGTHIVRSPCGPFFQMMPLLIVKAGYVSTFSNIKQNNLSFVYPFFILRRIRLSFESKPRSGWPLSFSFDFR